MMTSEFTHGWNSFSAPNHIFRVEAVIGIADSSYIFTVDGVPFVELPRDPHHGGGGGGNGNMYGRAGDNFTPRSNNRDSFGGYSNHSASPQGHHSGPNSYDPDTRGGFNADPFASDDPFSSSDPFGESSRSPPGTSRSNVSRPQSTANDPFGDDTSGKRVQSMRKSPAKAASGSNRASQRVQSINTSKAPVQVFNAFDDAPAPAPAPAANARPASTYLDDLSFLAPSTTTSPGKTADQILSTIEDPFAPKTTGIVQSAVHDTNATFGASAQPSGDILDVATKNLVSLDLNRPPSVALSRGAVPQSREDEYKKNLSLNTLLGQNNSKTPVMVAPEGFTPQAPVMPPAMSSADAISTLGGLRRTPTGMNQYGPPGGAPFGPPGMAPGPGGGFYGPPGGAPFGPPGMAPGPYGGNGFGAPVGAPVYGQGLGGAAPFGAPNGMPQQSQSRPVSMNMGAYSAQPYGGQPLQQSKGPQNSLDSINWRT